MTQRTTLVWVAVSTAVGVALTISTPLNHDVGWLLVAAQRLAAGAAVYASDVIEINPPLILYLYWAPVVFSDALGVSPIAAFRLWMSAAILASLWLTQRLVEHEPDARDANRGLLVALAFAYWIPFFESFGQREHWVAIGAMPYIVTAALRARRDAAPIPTSWAVAVGLAAGIAFAIKPHHLLTLAALEVWLATVRRSARVWWRSELVIAGCVALAYGLSVWLWLPAYFEFMVPLVRDTYWAYQKPLTSLVRGTDLAILAAAGIAAYSTRRPGPRLLAHALLIASVGFWLGHLVQHVGWRYHLMPFQVAAIASVGLALADWANEERARSADTLRVAVAATLLAASLGPAAAAALASLRDGGEWRAGRVQGDVAILGDVIESNGAESVFFFSTAIRAFPTVNHFDLGWSSRFPSLWILPPALRAAQTDSISAERAAELQRYLLAAVVEDFERTPPDLVFVDESAAKDYLTGVDFDFLRWFGRDPDFARIWAEYRPAGRLDRYALYRRRTEPIGNP